MPLKLSRSSSALKRLFGGARGRPVALGALLLCVAAQAILALPPRSQATLPALLTEMARPLRSARLGLFDAYQALAPRKPASQPVTIVAVDEKSLAALGQWPWPRDRLAQLVRAIQAQGPAAIGLDLYMPEADQNSPDQLARRLPPGQEALRAALRALPGNDAELAQALRDAPTVLGVAGFDFDTYTTSTALRSVPLEVEGADPNPFVRAYPRVLASLPMLQAAAHGQALVSIDTGGETIVRRVPLLARIGAQLVPSLAMEMLRVGSGSSAIEVHANKHGVTSVDVADLSVPTEPEGDIWLHLAPLSAGLGRYVSAIDVLRGKADPAQLAGKLVLIGLTGSGLNDMWTTALHELVPGVEIQAQIIESLYDKAFLRRPRWLGVFEPLLVLGIGLALIWLLPRSDLRLARWFKAYPRRAMGATLGVALALLILGLVLFQAFGLLFDAASVAIGLTLVVGALIASAVLESLGDAERKMAHLVESGIALGREHQRDGLAHMTLDSARQITGCQAALIYLKTEDGALTVLAQAGFDPATLSDIALADAGPSAVRPLAARSLAARVASDAKALNIDSIGHGQPVAPADVPLRLASGQAIRSVLSAPIAPSEGQVLGVIQLVNAVDPLSREVVGFDDRLAPFIEALAAQAAVGLENQNLVAARNALIDSIIKMIVGAIDAKSPYTGGHCERVPELAMMLARAACDVREGPLAGFDFNTAEQWREFRIGAWLHDCGKVTTPEYVVDKATKLETIYNRIHEIRTRFEVLLRDAQIERLRDIHERGVDAAEADRRYAQRLAQLRDDFEFLANSNLGGEFLAPEHIERIARIGGQTWLRHFDDRLGLSEAELTRHAGTAPQPLPAQERLLADKAEHLVPRPSKQADLATQHGFKVAVPEHLYNLGELHNLRISRGTLTAEERFKINEHIIQTIVMLEQLPLPPDLRRVPEYAGTHHETLTGTGYPRRLREDELSVPARIMAIADIFEALTASDRPYKKTKTLSESIRILSFFKKDRHIDPLLFDLFLSSGVYLDYARKYLLPDQIDAVDVASYLGPAA
jgi:HD-GYP domain-containing protein (c-di-GMP phosphodiesterase class II)/CHASE2 domain-containing sensor protein